MSALKVKGCTNHGCKVQWPPKPKGSIGTAAICSCLRNLVQDGNWLELQKALQCRDQAIEKLCDVLIDTASSLAAAISLLENGGKKAAPSDCMFKIMLNDYNKSLTRARQELTQFT